jgi:DHA2 family multidrug resistance protein-like MFS transporter
VASAILSVGHWPWLFAVNVPIGLVALALSVWALPQTDRSGGRFDVVSAILSAATFGLLISGFDGLAHGQTGVLVGCELAGTVIAGTLLIRRQASVASPMLPVDLLRLPIFALSAAAAFCCFPAQGAGFVAMPFLLQNTYGLSQVATAC